MGVFQELIVEELRQKQSYDLDKKIEYAKLKIEEFVKEMGGEEKVYISFSGGKDSTVLLHLVRSIYPNVPGVFFNTGLEFPEIVEFVKTFDNIEVRRPKKGVAQVWKENGLPVVSKTKSLYIRQSRTCKGQKTRDLRLNGEAYAVPKKWLHFTDTSFVKYKISEECCNFFKKNPSKHYTKETGKFPIIGTMVEESKARLQAWIKNGCNAFGENNIQSRPLSIWLEKDIYDYIKKYNIQICSLYDRRDRTGCYLCPYGVNIEDRETGTNRFELLKETHPNHYKSLNKLGIRQVLLDMQVPIRNDEEYMKDLEKRKIEINEWYAQNITNNKYSKYFTRDLKNKSINQNQLSIFDFDEVDNMIYED